MTKMLWDQKSITRTRKITNIQEIKQHAIEQWVNEEIKGEIEIYLETNESGNTTDPNQWCAAKAILRGKFIGIPFYLRNKKSQTL